MRARIDAVDDALADLLARRSGLAARAALLKLVARRPLLDASREVAVRRAYASNLRRAGWSAAEADRLVRPLLSVSRSRQRRLAVAIQGGAGSWSEASLVAALPGVRVRRFATVEEAWRATLAGETAAAWLARHNSLVGEVEATRLARREGDALLSRTVDVAHALLAARGARLADVAVVAGHPLALRQCAASLARLVPGARLVAAVDGAHAAARLRPGDGRAVVAGVHVAARRGLAVLAEGVADGPNRTTFDLLLPRLDEGRAIDYKSPPRDGMACAAWEAASPSPSSPFR